ncbi:unnamed protein product [Paramecium primaurelia]|uniref:Uncharacterized protein n=1 Tax=Paramecium primaurelia TaxID=5886 RepID=A0A8S1Q3K2_PARPR|nr:unnamed protein product [Paramecium primaurelia]
MNKKQNIPLKNIQPDTVPFSDGNALKYWRSFRHAITTIRLLQNPKTQKLNSPDELTISGYKSVNKTKHRSESSHNLSQALKNIQMQQSLFTSIEKGYSPDKIKEILDKDPKKYTLIIYQDISMIIKVNLVQLTKKIKKDQHLYMQQLNQDILKYVKFQSRKEPILKYVYQQMEQKKLHQKLLKDGNIQILFTFYNYKIDIDIIQLLTLYQINIYVFKYTFRKQIIKISQIDNCLQFIIVNLNQKLNLHFKQELTNIPNFSVTYIY